MRPTKWVLFLLGLGFAAISLTALADPPPPTFEGERNKDMVDNDNSIPSLKMEKKEPKFRNRSEKVDRRKQDGADEEESIQQTVRLGPDDGIKHNKTKLTVTSLFGAFRYGYGLTGDSEVVLQLEASAGDVVLIECEVYYEQDLAEVQVVEWRGKGKSAVLTGNSWTLSVVKGVNIIEFVAAIPVKDVYKYKYKFSGTQNNLYQLVACEVTR